MSDVQNTQNISITDSSDISIGDIKNVTSVEQSASTINDEIIKAFAVLIQKVNSLPESSDKNDAQSAVKALEAEASKGDEVQEKTVKKWLNFLLDTAPDVWQVAIDTFIHPIKGLSTVFQKVAKRAKAEYETAKSMEET